MANPTTNFGWVMPTSTDLVTDLPADFAIFGQAVDTSMAELKGGTTGQVLSKTSNTDMDFTWVAQDDSNAIQNAIVDAKGDLIAASAADTPARLAVGNNGETLVANSAASSGLTWASPVGSLTNPVINGGMDIWQRGTSTSIPASTYPSFPADRWITSTNTNQACTVARQATGDTTNLPNIQYAVRYQRNSGQTGTGALYLMQNFETATSIPYAGKTITLSFYARKGANYSATSSILVSSIQTGTGTDQNAFLGYTGAVDTPQNNTLTTSWQRFTQTLTIGATATEMSIYFLFNPTGTASTNDYYEITGVQIDVGTWTASTVPTFRRSGGTIQGELAACQRYYYRQTATTNAYMDFSTCGTASASTQVKVQVPLPVQMRVTPTSIDFSNLGVNDGATTTALSGLSFSEASPNFGAIATSGATGLTQYRPYFIRANNNVAAFLGFSAEL